MDINRNQNFTDLVNKLNIEFSDNGYVSGDTSWKGKNMCSPFSRLYYMESGEGIIEYNSKKIILEPGYVYIIPAAFTFSFYCESEYKKLFFHFSIYGRSGYDIFFDCNECMRKKISKDKFNMLKENYLSGAAEGILYVKNEVLKCAISFIGEEKATKLLTTKYSSHVKDTIDYINSHLSLQLNTKYMAERLFISKSSLNRRFKEETGVTISNYIDDLVFMKAEKMLLKTDLSLSKISAILGFCDQFYFSRRFKERYGITPSQYRKMQISY